MAEANVGQIELDLILNSKRFATQLETTVNRSVSKAMGGLNKKTENWTEKIRKGGEQNLKALQESSKKRFEAMEKQAEKAAAAAAKAAAKQAKAAEKAQRAHQGKIQALLSSVNGEMGTAFGSMMKFGKIALVIGLVVKALKALVAFAKQAIEEGSKLQQAQYAINATFPHMKKEVDAFADASARAFGLSKTEAKKFVGMAGAMAKNFGFTEQEAFKMSTTLSAMAGDVAAFYGISQEEGFTRLKSVFTGETETLKELGVVMTHTALEEFAMAHGIEKSYKNMSEHERVALRYFFVQEKLNASSGHFLKIQNTYAGQMTQLKSNWSNFSAEIGQVLNRLLVPVLKVINAILNGMAALARTFRMFLDELLGTEEIAGGVMDEAAGSTDDLSDSLGDANEEAKKLKKSLLGIDQLNILKSSKDDELLNGGLGGGSLDDFASHFDKTEETAPDVGGLDLSWLENNKTLENVRKYLSETFQYIREQYDEYVAPVWKDFFGDINDTWEIDGKPMMEEMGGLMENLKQSGEQLWPLLDLLIKNFIKGSLKMLGFQLSLLLGFLDNLLSFALDVSTGIIKALNGLVDFIMGALTGDWERAWNGLKDILAGIMDSMVSIFVAPINVFIDLINKLTEKLNGIKLPSWLGGKEINIPVIQRLKGAGFTEKMSNKFSGEGRVKNQSNKDNYAVMTPTPFLAQGGYVRPNMPQLAVVGDNRHQGEIIAPEGKIQEAVSTQITPLLSKLDMLINLLSSGAGNGDKQISLKVDLDGDTIAERVLDIQDRRIMSSGGWA